MAPAGQPLPGRGCGAVPAGSVPCPRQPAAAPRHLSVRGPPSVPPVKLSLRQCQASAKCQTTRVPAARGQQGKGVFTARGEGKGKGKQQGGLQDPGAQKEEEGTAVCSKLFAALRRKRCVDGERGPAAQQGWGDRAVLYVPGPLPCAA